jgi:hypothetical protein
MSVIGTDVSRWQPDWHPAPDDRFAIVKATQGTTVRNPERNEQLQRARDAGLLIGHYHYLERGNSAAQARHFLNSENFYETDTLWCDWEGDWAAGKHPSVEDAATFIAAVKAARPWSKVGLYCNVSDWLTTTVKKGDALWIARYGRTPGDPGIRPVWDLHQYTDDPIDKNISRLNTFDELATWWTSPPSPTPPPGPFWSEEYQSEFVSMNGEWVTPLDKTILEACAKAVGWGKLNIVQGGLSAGSLSAKTHYGLAVGDIQTLTHSTTLVWELAAALLRSGVVPFLRGYGGGDSFAKHIHFASRESYDAGHDQLQKQIDEYLQGGDGLVGDRRYYGPDIRLSTWKQSPYNPANITEDDQLYKVTTEKLPLLGRDVDHKIVTRAAKGSFVKAAKRIRRWGRDNVVTGAGVFYAAEFLTQTQEF